MDAQEDAPEETGDGGAWDNELDAGALDMSAAMADGAWGDDLDLGMEGMELPAEEPVDPRAYKLLEMGRAEAELKGDKIRALETLSQAVDEVAGRAITINATGAVAALLGEIGVPTAVMRGFAVISRAAGLVAHIVEEQNSPSGRFIWDTIEHAIPFVGCKDGQA